MRSGWNQPWNAHTHTIITGVIKGVLLRGDKGASSVFLVNPDDGGKPIVVIGVAIADAGMRLTAEGVVAPHPRHGRQLNASSITAERAMSPETMISVITGAGIPGVGTRTVRRLIEELGVAGAQKALDGQPDVVAGIRGIGEHRAKAVMAAWRMQSDDRSEIAALRRMGIAQGVAKKIAKHFKGASTKIVTTDPYRLCAEVDGIGFKTADEIASLVGMPFDDPRRIRAGLFHILETATAVGDCGVPRGKLRQKAAQALGVSEALCAEALDAELAIPRGQGGRIEVHDGVAYPTRLAIAEEKVAECLLALAKGAPSWTIDAARALDEACKDLNVTLATQQQAAVIMALSHKVSVLTGGPGTGKTTTLRVILHIFQKLGVRVALCAPTGKAAKRATEATGMQATTIHRLLGLQGQGESDTMVDAGDAVCDESSMMDVPLAAELVSSLSANCAMLIVGDVDQLPSVGPGQVLADIINSGAVPVTRLTEIFRQAAGSLIIRNAHRINKGLEPESGGKDDDFFILQPGAEIGNDEVGNWAAATIADLVTRRLPERYGFNPLHDIQVLCPMNKGSSGVIEMNNRLQALLNPAARVFVERGGYRFSPGDKIIQTRNNYEFDIFNGDIGYIQNIAEGRVLVSFDGNSIDLPIERLEDIKLAYAMTIHKSQGSEAPAVVIPVTTQHFVMLQRNLLYTGITRGKQLVVLVGQARAIAIAVKNDQALRRVSRLCSLLQTPGIAA